MPHYVDPVDMGAVVIIIMIASAFEIIGVNTLVQQQSKILAPLLVMLPAQFGEQCNWQDHVEPVQSGKVLSDRVLFQWKQTVLTTQAEITLSLGP